MIISFHLYEHNFFKIQTILIDLKERERERAKECDD